MEEHHIYLLNNSEISNCSDYKAVCLQTGLGQEKLQCIFVMALLLFIERD